MRPMVSGPLSSPLNTQLPSIKTPKSGLRRAVLICSLLSWIVLHGIAASRSLWILWSQNAWNALSALSLSGSENVRLDLTMVQRMSASSSSLNLKSHLTSSEVTHCSWVHLNQRELPHNVFRQYFIVLCKRPLNVGDKIIQRREW
jgi:hypothetical protein